VIKKLYHLKGKDVTIHCFNEERGGIKRNMKRIKTRKKGGEGKKMITFTLLTFTC
jgi:hypothetical protein